jgi:hypothetical protein
MALLVRLVALGSVILLLVSCSVEGEDVPIITARSWTVLIYMAADNDLAGAAVADFAEMERATTSSYVTVLVQRDLKGDQARRYRIANGKTTEVSALGQIDSASEAALTDFLVWAGQAAPADRTVLILWDHGSGWSLQDGLAKTTAKRVYAMLSDDSSGSPLLANVKIRSAIERSGIKPDILGFDGCNMGTIEALYEFRNLAPILVASQELEPLTGWDYTAILSSLANNPGQTQETFAAAIVATYRASMETLPPTAEHAGTLSALRSAKLEALAVEADRVARLYLARLADPLQNAQAVSDLATARKDAQAIDLYAQPYEYVDLADFLVRLDPSTTVLRLMTDALIAEYHGKDRPGAHGLSIVFYKLPEAKTYNVFDPNYRNFDPATGTGSTSEFINKFNWDELMANYFAAGGG